MRIRPGNGPHAIKLHLETRFEQPRNGIKIKQCLHQRGIISHRINHLNCNAAKGDYANLAEIDVACRNGLVTRNGFGARKNQIGNFLWRWPAIACIIFNAEITIRPAGVVAG